MSIVTLPCDFGGRRAVSFDVWGVYSDRVFLADLCAKWNGYVSVTDAGEEVCRHCYAQFGNMRVINYGGFGWQWMELVHDNGAFKGLVSYGESIPFGVIGAWFMNGAGGDGIAASAANHPLLTAGYLLERDDDSTNSERRDAVAIDDGVVSRGIGGIDRDTPERDGAEHCKGQERGSQGGHLGFGFLNF